MQSLNPIASRSALCMQCSFCGVLASSPYVLASRGALCMQCNSRGVPYLQCSSRGYFVMEYMQPLCCILQYNSHRTVPHLSKWHCMKLLWGTSQCNSHRAVPHLSKWHCMKLLWSTSQCNSHRALQQGALHEALTTLHKSTGQHIS